MASDASSGPRKLPFPVRDIKFEQGLQVAGSYSSVAIRKHDVHVDKGEDSEFIASCSLMDVAPRKHQFKSLDNGQWTIFSTKTRSVEDWMSPLKLLAKIHLRFLHPTRICILWTSSSLNAQWET
jgi:hypothetical protein